MKKPLFLILIFAPFVLALASCNDAIFYIVSQETAILDPLINGAPSNFAVANINSINAMYAASGRNIWRYHDKSWHSVPFTIPGKIYITRLAATGPNLFALYVDSSGTGRVANYNITGWTELPPTLYNNAQAIFTADGNLFICSRPADAVSDIYNIYVTTDGTNLSSIKSGVKYLNGVALDGTTYYLCTKGGIYSGTNINSLGFISDSDKEFTGIINISPGFTVAITRGGELYKISLTSVGTPIASFSGNRLSTGALAVWENPTNSSEKLLLAGRQDSLIYSTDSGYTYGYLEIELDTNSIKSGETFKEPGSGGLSTVSDNARYVSSIGKHPINHIFQSKGLTNDNVMILFASTQKRGVWAYRERNGTLQWNAEE